MASDDIAENRKGNLFVVSGPSGAGKGTLLERALPRVSGAWNSISCTTRAPRGHEVDGVDYHFLTDEEFLSLRDSGGLLEWACVHGHYYGTPRAQAQEHIAAGDQVFLEIDVQGGLKVRRNFPEACLIFIKPPSLEVLERRLRGRGTECEAEISKRLADATAELAQASEYDFVVVNDDLERATIELLSIIESRAANTKEH